MPLKCEGYAYLFVGLLLVFHLAFGYICVVAVNIANLDGIGSWNNRN
jgi:hypothetical protein